MTRLFAKAFIEKLQIITVFSPKLGQEKMLLLSGNGGSFWAYNEINDGCEIVRGTILYQP